MSLFLFLSFFFFFYNCSSNPQELLTHFDVENGWTVFKYKGEILSLRARHRNKEFDCETWQPVDGLVEVWMKKRFSFMFLSVKKSKNHKIKWKGVSIL